MYNLLIADADVDAWFRVNALLRSYKVKANFVSNLGEAKCCMENEHPSLLIIDRQLLKDSAGDFFQYIKSTFPAVKTILVNRLGESAGHWQAGADLVICKPIVPEIIESAFVQLSLLRLQNSPASNK